MLASFLNGARTSVTFAVLLAFVHTQMMAAVASGRLVPGGFPQNQQQSPTPTQPGEVQTPPAQQQQQPNGNDQSTTVVQVPVPKDRTLDITVLEGEGAENVAGKKVSVRPLVQVRDESNKPLEGAVVTFLAPADGASVVFSNGLRTVTVMTDAEGHARAPNMRAVDSGSFRLQVSASFRGEMVSTSVSQTNFDSAAEAKTEPASANGSKPPATNAGKTGGLSRTTWLLIIGAGAAAAVGIGVGLGHKGASSTTSSSSATIGGAGGVTVGAP